MTTSPEHVAAETLVARIEELLPKVAAGPWEVVSDLPCYAIAAGQHRVVQTANQNNYRHFGATERWLGIESREHAAWIALLNPENVKVLLSALRRQSPASHANAVKALEWKKDRGSVAWATSILGTYYVNPSEDHPGKFYAYNSGHLLFDSGYQDDEDAAKAFAQADYERRILSALTASPSPAGAVAPAVGVVEAAILQERERIAQALDDEADTASCMEDATVVRDCARLVRADFSYEEVARRLEEASLQPAPHPDTDSGGGQAAPQASDAQGGVVDEIAKIIDPHSFLPDNSGDELIAEMVRQGMELARSKATRILAALGSALQPAGVDGWRTEAEIALKQALQYLRGQDPGLTSGENRNGSLRNRIKWVLLGCGGPFRGDAADGVA